MKQRIIIILMTVSICLSLFPVPVSAYAYDLTEADTPEHAEFIIYGQSGAGRDLLAYRFGTGENVMVVGFAIHGFEDNFDYDGLALVYTARQLMTLLNDNIDTINHYGWSIYVLPCMNPDGLLDGYSCNGPGRCTTTYLNSSGTLISGSGLGIDMNRSFPYGWVKKTDARNFNGSQPLACLESQALAQFIQDVKGDGQNICIDVHGWLSQIIPSTGTSSQLYQIFKKAFPNNTYANCMNGAGYFTAYAGSIGYSACLFEFPAGITSLSGFTSSGYPETFNQCILSLAEAYGTYRELEPEPEPEANHEEYCPALAFEDLSTQVWYHEAVDFCLEKNLFQGTSSTTFAPELPMTRAMLVTVLYRMSGKSVDAADVSEISTIFPDVQAGSWYTEAVAWAYAIEMVTGYPDGSFGPEDAVTREQMVTILYRYVKWYGAAPLLSYDDLSGYADRSQVGTYAMDPMGWACANGVIHGTVVDGNACLSPLKSATRAEVAQVLMNYCGNVLGMDTSVQIPETAAVTDGLFSIDEEFTPTDGTDLGGN